MAKTSFIIDNLCNKIYNKKDMSNFYIFLDIDGVFYDYEWLKNSNNKASSLLKFKPESITALNHLISSLEKQHNVDLVIISTWRLFKFEQLIAIFKNSGLNFDKTIHKTKDSTNPFTRSKDIMQYLKGKNNKENFVIIDDESFDFDLYFDKKNIIKTNIQNNALNKKMVDKFLNTLNKDEELTF